MRRPAHPPADDPAGIGVDDKGDIDEAGPGGDIGEIGHPQRIRARRLELAIDVVERARRGPVAHRGAHGLTPSDADRPANVRKAWDVAGVRLRRLVPVCRPDTSLPDVQMMTDPFRLLRSPSTSEPAYLAWCAGLLDLDQIAQRELAHDRAYHCCSLLPRLGTRRKWRVHLVCGASAFERIIGAASCHPASARRRWPTPAACRRRHRDWEPRMRRCYRRENARHPDL